MFGDLNTIDVPPALDDRPFWQIRNCSNSPKFIYSDSRNKKVKNISSYLTEGNNIYVNQRKQSISNLPEMSLGSSGIDGGHLLLSKEEKELFISNSSESTKFIKKFIGGQDLLRNNERYCLWIDDDLVEEANKVPLIKERIERCKNYRLNGGRDAKKGALVPHRFFYRKYKDGESVILPFTSSANRDYLPVGFEPSGTISSNGLLVIYGSEIYMFGLLSSKIHWIWLNTV